MSVLNNLILATLSLLVITSCNLKPTETVTQKEEITDRSVNVEGNYVDTTYEKRAEGFDWVGISVQQLSDTVINIKVRSRADLKGPTCTLDAQASKTRTNVYRTMLEGKPVLLSFDDESVHIKSELVNDSTILNFYCSGGASLGGRYKKIKEDLDSTQVDRTSFIKNLKFNGISFSIRSKHDGDKEQLTITPTGLSIDNDIHSHDITGQTVLDAQIGDMNKDGYPEVLVYTQSHGSGSYGSIIGYSVNKGKSLSQIYFPPTAANPKINKGYLGHDSFSLVDGYLIQKFPVYQEGDTNANPTGKHRAIKYELTDGESTRILVVTSAEEL
ncbi:PliI family lysozyme inhibitor of I-type lysozyme [Sphingobacterium tabacisoli]|uniref:PliI family lysozyme inhibitor of I-type lysozyme n=1 Tax=Sphingobacterium tabacisoli TaxID=2044855 RepID=A0ABW5KZQ6_9SPHI|nr:PliI family lysozyme inhibitor of I-type lysozyme [Sphingobacterium tabacisoli]